MKKPIVLDDEHPFAVKPPTPEGMAGWLRAGVRTVQRKVRAWFNAPVAKAGRKAHEEAFFRLLEEAQARAARENHRMLPPLPPLRRVKADIASDIVADIVFVKSAPPALVKTAAEAEIPPEAIPEPPPFFAPEPSRYIAPPEPPAPVPPVVAKPAPPETPSAPTAAPPEPVAASIADAVFIPPAKPKAAREPKPEAPPERTASAATSRSQALASAAVAGAETARSARKAAASAARSARNAATAAVIWRMVRQLYDTGCAAGRFSVVLWHKLWFGCLRLPEPVRRISGPVIQFGAAAWTHVVSWFEPQGEILRAAVPFQPDLDEIIEEPPPPAMRGTYYFMVGLVAVLLLITSLFDVEIVITGAGQLSADAPPIVLQPMERAVIREIKVKAGDVVKKGELLARLDPTFAQADVETLSVQHTALLAQVMRIEAEIDGKPFNIGSTANAAEILQAAVHTQRQAQYASRIQAFDEEIQRWEANIRATEEERSFMTMQLNIASEVEGMRTQLWQGRLTSKLQYLESQSNRLRSARDLQSAVDRLTELRHSLQGKRAERQAFIDEWRRQQMEELASRRTELAKTVEGLAKATRMRELVSLVAPEDGVVLDVAKRSVGSVMREAEPLITLVSSGAPLVGEIVIGSSDVGYAAPGNEVVIKVDAFPYQRHGMLKGRLLSISEESYTPGAPRGADGASGPSMGGAFHRARVALIDTRLKDLPEGVRLIPGMTLTAEIQVGKRSVISYILNPITRGLSEAMREP